MIKRTVGKRIFSILLAALLALTAVLPASSAAIVKMADVHYPYVFVHGMGGWGADEGINDLIPYWGATTGALMPKLRENGYECYDASVGPISSCWDRACELYAQMVGDTVDYGEAHAKAHNHARYGRTYTTPLFDGWGKSEKNGVIKKVNLVGHSFGGNTIRLLTELLANGDETERQTTPAEELSPLFTGGKANWVHSVTTLCTPHNGSTLRYIADEFKLTDLVKAVSYAYAGVMGRSLLNGFVDFHLEQFGLTAIPGESAQEHLIRALKLVFEQTDDSVVMDLSPDGAALLNNQIGMEENIYYFSYSYLTTHKSALTGHQVANANTLLVLIPFANLIGRYADNTDTDYPIDESWLPNDGLVSVVSAQKPSDDPGVDYDASHIVQGSWNVMPTLPGDHGTVIGLNADSGKTLQFYLDMMQMIESLPKTAR